MTGARRLKTVNHRAHRGFLCVLRILEKAEKTLIFKKKECMVMKKGVVIVF